MKFTWQPEDITCGRIVCKPAKYYTDVWAAKWTHKIGWLAGGNPLEKRDYSTPETRKSTRKDYCLIAMTDGMIDSPRTRQETADWLNKNEMIPMSQKNFLTVIKSLHILNEEGNHL